MLECECTDPPLEGEGKTVGGHEVELMLHLLLRGGGGGDDRHAAADIMDDEEADVAAAAADTQRSKIHYKIQYRVIECHVDYLLPTHL